MILKSSKGKEKRQNSTAPAQRAAVCLAKVTGSYPYDEKHISKFQQQLLIMLSGVPGPKKHTLISQST